MRLICCILCLPLLPLAAKVDLWRGSMALLDHSENVSLEVAGKDPFSTLGADAPLPLYLEGVFRLRSAAVGESFLRSSNGVDLFFEGPGDFAVERFDQAFSRKGPAQELELERSWLLMNLRKGNLVVDSREATGLEQMVVVAPFGRILAPPGLWSISIDYEVRNQRYDFTVACAEGQVRLTDRQGQTFTLYPGQRLAGVGAFLNPAIEIGEATARSRERFRDFLNLRDTLPLDRLDPAAYRAAMLDLPDLDAVASAPDFSSGRPVREPLVIEYAQPPRELTPFRGVVRRPEAHSSETF